MTHAVVTGSSGFIGHQLVNSLTSIGFDIGNIDEEYFRSADWKDALVNELNRLNPKTIFHVGACSDTLEQDVQFMMTRNYESTKVIADWCVLKNRELVYSSSAANYGEDGRYPSNLYGWSKYVAENYVLKSGGLALRYFNVYGPGEEHKGKMASFLYQAYLKKKAGDKIQLFPGTPRRDFIYIKDVIAANIFAQTNFKNLQGNYYEVGTGVANSFEQQLDIFGLKYEYSDEDKIPMGYQFYTCGNPKKWMAGWLPTYSLEVGVLEYKSYLMNEVEN